VTGRGELLRDVRRESVRRKRDARMRARGIAEKLGKTLKISGHVRKR
jgi:hypothetical protein